MTTPATPCPHCGRSIAYKPAQHETSVRPTRTIARPTAPCSKTPAKPGVLRIKPEYEEARGELFSGTFLMRTWACGWATWPRTGLARHREAEPRKPIQWLDKTLKVASPEIDAQIERNRATTAPGKESGCRCWARGGKCSTVAKFTSTIR